MPSDLSDIRERIGRLVDTTDNYSMYAHPPMWGFPGTQDALQSGFRAIREELRAIYIELGGDDEWAAFEEG